MKGSIERWSLFCVLIFDIILTNYFLSNKKPPTFTHIKPFLCCAKILYCCRVILPFLLRYFGADRKQHRYPGT
jgi:hypothetical protein